MSACVVVGHGPWVRSISRIQVTTTRRTTRAMTSSGTRGIMYLSDHCSISNMACYVEPKMNTTKDPKNRQFSDRGIVSSPSCIYFVREVLVLLLCQYSSGCPKQASAWTSAVKPRELIPHHDGIIILRVGKTSNNNVSNQQFYMLNLNSTPAIPRRSIKPHQPSSF
jgi:hypothetical protein